jgi:hypothetical protein
MTKKMTERDYQEYDELLTELKIGKENNMVFRTCIKYIGILVTSIATLMYAADIINNVPIAALLFRGVAYAILPILLTCLYYLLNNKN